MGYRRDPGGVIHGITRFVPTLVEQGEGHVVITSSLAGWSARPGLGPYAATKHAVLGLGKSLRRELELTEADLGVSVLCAGLVNTNIMTSARNWPAALGTDPPTPTNPVSTAVIEGLSAGTTGGGADPSVAAEAVVHGILNKEFILRPTVSCWSPLPPCDWKWLGEAYPSKRPPIPLPGILERSVPEKART